MFWLPGPDNDDGEEEEKEEEKKDSLEALDEFAWVDELFESDVDNTAGQDRAGPDVGEQAWNVGNAGGFAWLGEVDESVACAEIASTVPISTELTPMSSVSTSFADIRGLARNFIDEKGAEGLSTPEALTQFGIEEGDAEGQVEVEAFTHCFGAGPFVVQDCVFAYTGRKSSTRKRKREDRDEDCREAKRFCGAER